LRFGFHRRIIPDRWQPEQGIRAEPQNVPHRPASNARKREAIQNTARSAEMSLHGFVNSFSSNGLSWSFISAIWSSDIFVPLHD
jgi:hypothetical protein